MADGQLGAHLDLTGGKLLVVGRQHAQDQISGYRQAVAGAPRAHESLVKYGSVTSAPTAWNCTCTRMPIVSSSRATPTMFVSIW